MVISIFYPSTNRNNNNKTISHDVSAKLITVPKYTVVRDAGTTEKAIKLVEHMEIVEESRKIIKEGQTINWDDYAKSKK